MLESSLKITAPWNDDSEVKIEVWICWMQYLSSCLVMNTQTYFPTTAMWAFLNFEQLSNFENWLCLLCFKIRIHVKTAQCKTYCLTASQCTVYKKSKQKEKSKKQSSQLDFFFKQTNPNKAHTLLFKIKNQQRMMKEDRGDGRKCCR